MACVACESYEKRITNVFRDEELKKKYEKLIGFKVTADCFICDNCKRRLVEALKFQQNCIRVYKKNNPNYQPCSKSSSKTSEIEDTYSNEEPPEPTNLLPNDEFPDFKFIGTETVFENVERQSCVKIPKNEIEVHKCVIIEKQSDPFMSFDDDQINTYREDSPTDYSLLDKKPKRVYSLTEKLKLIKFAEEYSNREAARKFGVNESTIRFFRKQKARMNTVKPKKKKKEVKIENDSEDDNKCLAELM
ncbi:hypothetical protein ACKWTF_010460 [Chironomus riparius]